MNLSFRINTIVFTIFANLCTATAQKGDSKTTSPAVDTSAQHKQIMEQFEELRELMESVNSKLSKGKESSLGSIGRAYMEALAERSLGREYMGAFPEKGSLQRDYMSAFPGPPGTGQQYPQPPQRPQDSYEYPVLIIPESSFYSRPYPVYPHTEQRYVLPPSSPPAYPRQP
ncbi:hypothetical protein ANCCAN_09450 [Ancylostoma caninum]|uniref:Uncharacterized protein n=1 Tax=Ancylostoma caninum TaxID=29170 RepID=A0A368GJL1_ANCCA|nr:hypothetical protein ANCCAN_09450 [Ancylostoma caninum]